MVIFHSYTSQYQRVYHFPDAFFPHESQIQLRPAAWNLRRNKLVFWKRWLTKVPDVWDDLGDVEDGDVEDDRYLQNRHYPQNI